jgi:hypothetical protein
MIKPIAALAAIAIALAACDSSTSLTSPSSSADTFSAASIATMRAKIDSIAVGDTLARYTTGEGTTASGGSETDTGWYGSITKDSSGKYPYGRQESRWESGKIDVVRNWTDTLANDSVAAIYMLRLYYETGKSSKWRWYRAQ